MYGNVRKGSEIAVAGNARGEVEIPTSHPVLQNFSSVMNSPTRLSFLGVPMPSMGVVHVNPIFKMACFAAYKGDSVLLNACLYDHQSEQLQKATASAMVEELKLKRTLISGALIVAQEALQVFQTMAELTKITLERLYREVILKKLIYAEELIQSVYDARKAEVLAQPGCIISVAGLDRYDALWRAAIKSDERDRIGPGLMRFLKCSAATHAFRDEASFLSYYQSKSVVAVQRELGFAVDLLLKNEQEMEAQYEVAVSHAERSIGKLSTTVATLLRERISSDDLLLLWSLTSLDTMSPPDLSDEDIAGSIVRSAVHVIDFDRETHETILHYAIYGMIDTVQTYCNELLESAGPSRGYSLSDVNRIEDRLQLHYDIFQLIYEKTNINAEKQKDFNELCERFGLKSLESGIHAWTALWGRRGTTLQAPWECLRDGLTKAYQKLFPEYGSGMDGTLWVLFYGHQSSDETTNVEARSIEARIARSAIFFGKNAACLRKLDSILTTAVLRITHGSPADEDRKNLAEIQAYCENKIEPTILLARQIQCVLNRTLSVVFDYLNTLQSSTVWRKPADRAALDRLLYPYYTFFVFLHSKSSDSVWLKAWSPSQIEEEMTPWRYINQFIWKQINQANRHYEDVTSSILWWFIHSHGYRRPREIALLSLQMLMEQQREAEKYSFPSVRQFILDKRKRLKEGKNSTWLNTLEILLSVQEVLVRGGALVPDATCFDSFNELVRKEKMGHDSPEVKELKWQVAQLQEKNRRSEEQNRRLKEQNRRFQEKDHRLEEKAHQGKEEMQQLSASLETRFSIDFSKKFKPSIFKSLAPPSTSLPFLDDTIVLPGRVVDVPGDGACFFHALAHELRRQGLEHLSHLEIRIRAVEYLERSRLLDEILPELNGKIVTAKTYLTEMRKQFTWAEGAILEAAALAFNVSLSISEVRRMEQGSELHPMHINEHEACRGVIGLVREDRHYKALEFVSEYAAVEASESTRSFPATSPGIAGVFSAASGASGAMGHIESSDLEADSHPPK